MISIQSIEKAKDEFHEKWVAEQVGLWTGFQPFKVEINKNWHCSNIYFGTSINEDWIQAMIAHFHIIGIFTSKEDSDHIIVQVADTAEISDAFRKYMTEL